MGIVVVAAFAASAAGVVDADGRHLVMHQIGRQRRQPITSIVRPAVFDPHVLALAVTGLSQPLSERGNPGRIGRRGAEKPDHWHRRLLRMRSERPCGC